jgi:Toprim domain
MFDPEWPQQMEECARMLWGAPHKSSTSTDLRFGRTGAIHVDLVNCIWNDFHPGGDGGGFIDLYRLAHGRNPDRAEPRKTQASIVADEAEKAAEAAAKRESMERVRAELVCPKRTCVERYLRERGIDLAGLDDLFYHKKLWHNPTGRWWPAMVALVRDASGQVVAIHRTWLSYTDPPTKAPIEPNRMMLCPADGCAIHLAPAAPKMLIGEGIETTAAAMRLAGLPGWAAMAAGNLAKVVLPDLVREVVIAADNDEAGIKGAIAAAQRFQREGREVWVRAPEEGNWDYNDLLRRRVVV